MKTYEVTIYASKSTRKNAKTIYKSFRIWPDSKNGKKQFTDTMDSPEVVQWIANIKKEYPVFHVVAYMDNINICSWEAAYLSDHQAKEKTITIMNLFNYAAKNF